MNRRDQGSPRRLPQSIYDVLTELSLVLFTLAVVVSFLRLFDDGSFFVPIAASAITAHILAATVRWARGGLFVSALVSLLGLVATTRVLFPPTTVVDANFLDDTVFRGFVTDLELAWEQFQTVLAPTEATAPFLLLVSLVMWTTAFLADWAAFRLRAPVEALIPGLAVFVFGALFAAEQNRLFSSIVFVGAALVFVLLHRLGETAKAGAWLGVGAAERGQSALLRGGLAIVVATVVSGAVVAQALPGYGEDPVVDISELDDTQSARVVLSPLVDIQSKLIDQPDIEVFRVRSDRPDYWRITSLDVFDGRIWRSRGSFEDASGALDTELPPGTNFEAVAQSFDIKALGGIWLPAAYEPSDVLAAPPGVEFEYEAESGTLIVNRDLAVSDGLSYTINSAVPLRDPETIAAAGNAVPADIGNRYLELPADFGVAVVEEAERIVAEAGATSPYEKALALQDFFRDPSLFAYSLDVSNGHSSQRLEDFLFTVRVGYCEQFAGTYAAMARSIGLPARVAVGFTKGEVVDGETDLYSVTGKHAHAWPEVWIDGIGWLRFEPTPGRGAPGDEPYTRQPEQQANAIAGAPATTAPERESEFGPQNRRPFEEEFPTTTAAAQSDRGQSGTIAGVGISRRTLFRYTLGLVLLLGALTIPMLYGMYRASQRRREVAGDPGRRIGLAWSESRSAVELLGVKTSKSDTPTELVQRLEATDASTARTLSELADDVTTATFGNERMPADRADRAEELSRELAARARAHKGRFAWWKHHADPRNVFGAKPGLWGHLRR